MNPFDPRLTPARPDLAAAHLRGQIAAANYAEGRTMRVAQGTANVHRAPDAGSPLETQALFGEKVMLYEEREGWGWVQLVSDGYVGYVPLAALEEGFEEPSHRVRVNQTFVYPAPNIKLPPCAALPLGAGVRVREIKGAFAQIAEAAFVFADHLTTVGAAEEDFVGVAERLLHAPYLWGGKTSGGIDCSGLVQVSLSAAGIMAPRDTDLQERALGMPLGLGAGISGLRRGDLVFWRGHVGIMRDSETLLHANAHHMLVASEPLAVARERILAHTALPLQAVKRLAGS
ncbi:MAG TPA: NlpC/P60 family protein [Methylocella sp.]|nr:NlpC/P60 family protein [Methylocella sp.]